LILRVLTLVAAATAHATACSATKCASTEFNAARQAAKLRSLFCATIAIAAAAACTTTYSQSKGFKATSLSNFFHASGNFTEDFGHCRLCALGCEKSDA